MNLNARLSEVFKGQRESFLAYMAQKPSEILEGQGKLKEGPEEPTKGIEIPEQTIGHWVPAKKGNPGSMLLKPSDRKKFLNWGKKKIKKQLNEQLITLKKELEVLRPRLAAAAQEIYDAWDQSEEFDDYSGGGICDAIASAMHQVIADSIDAHIDEGGHEGDDHAFLLVSRAGERYWVDIPPGVYETGGGYNWTRIPDATIKPEDVVIERI